MHGLPSKLDQYLRLNHKFVHGWLLPGAARMVVALADKQTAEGVSGNVAEIGIHHGKLFILLYLLSRDNERAVAIDLFSMQDLNVDRSGKGNLAKFRANMARYADTTRLVVHEGDSMLFDGAQLINLAGGPCRLISVDGGHTAEITAHDLATAEDALVTGGIIILDDVFNEMWPGVSDGTHQYFREGRSVVPFAIGGNKTLFCHPSFANRYADALRSVAARTTEHGFLGARVLCCDFGPLVLRERLDRLQTWRTVKNTWPVKNARHAYRVVTAAIERFSS